MKATYPKTTSKTHAGSFVLAGLLCFGLTGMGQDQYFDFDQDEDTGWTRFSPLDVVGASSIFTFPDDGSGGKAYRLQSPAPPVDAAGPARSFTYLPEVLTDFVAAVDVIDWDNTVNQAFGFLFRAENIGLGQTTGYVLNYDPNQASGARGQIQMNIVTGEVDAGTIGAADLSLQPGRDYRFVLMAEGTNFDGYVYDLSDLTRPIIHWVATDTLYSQGRIGLFNFYRGSGITNPETAIADTTFDNFTVSTDVASYLEALPATPHSVPGTAHVLEVQPGDRSSFVTDNTLNFTVGTRSDIAVDPSSVRVFLNGQNVTAGLSSSASTFLSNPSLSFNYTGLEPNRIYDCRIEIDQAGGGIHSTEFSFDTLTEAFLETDEVKVIEAEDYNFEAGQYIDDPLASGLIDGITEVNINEGYLDRMGTPGIDFMDHSSQPGSNEIPEYRLFDFVGTQAGSVETGELDVDHPPINDVIRTKYSELNLPEYQVRGTQGGEWLNYTRDFNAGEYHAYLRVAARAEQDVILSEVISGVTTVDQVTEDLGVFAVPNMGMQSNYRFVPLVNADGERVTLNLSGTQTLRLTLGGEPVNATNGTMALNYLLLTPDLDLPQEPGIVVESATTVNGPYSIVAAAVVTDSSISVPVDGGQAFFRFRLGLGGDFTITNWGLADGMLTISYQ